MCHTTANRRELTTHCLSLATAAKTRCHRPKYTHSTNTHCNTHAHKMNRFQVSSVEITGDSGQSNGAGGGSTLTSNGQQQQPPHSRSGRPGNGSVVAGSGELQLSAYNLVSNEAGPSSAGAGPSTMPASTSSAGAGAAAGNNDAASSGSGLQRKFSIQQLTR